MPLRCDINGSPGTPGLVILPAAGFRRLRDELARWPGAAPTALHDPVGLPVPGRVAIKDETARWGIGGTAAFAAAIVAADLLLALLARRGHHAGIDDLFARRHDLSGVGLSAAQPRAAPGVAWAAARFGAAFYAALNSPEPDLSEPDASAPDPSTETLRVDLVAHPGNTEQPRLAMQALRLPADEALDQWAGPPPTHMVLGADPAALAAAASVQLRARTGAGEPPPRLVLVAPAGQGAEPPDILAAAELDRSRFATLHLPAGAAEAAAAHLSDSGLPASPRGALGLAGLLLAAADPAVAARLGLGADSRTLLFATEPPANPDGAAP